MTETAIKTTDVLLRPEFAPLKGRATQVRVPLDPPVRGYPSIYPLKTTFGHGLFASEGKHRGSGLGTFYYPALTLYGARNHAENGGLAWQRGKHRRIECPWKIGELFGERILSGVYPTSLQDIWPADILACGVPIQDLAKEYKRLSDRGGNSFVTSLILADEASAIFAKWWDRRFGKGSWAANPWVWVLSFRQLPAGIGGGE